ncbi:hypothetical protein AT2G13555, partial [Arabidopsis thaliana]
RRLVRVVAVWRRFRLSSGAVSFGSCFRSWRDFCLSAGLCM